MKYYLIIAILLLLLSCSNNSEKEQTAKKELIKSNDVERIEPISKSISDKVDSLEEKTKELPLHGGINQQELSQYYPNLIDTIKDIRILGSEKIDLKIPTGIIVSILHNTGTFDQMIICTHDSSLKLIDDFYIGKATAFDRTSHTIEYKISGNNRLYFEHVDWGYVKKNEDYEIDTVKYINYFINIGENGQIKKTDK